MSLSTFSRLSSPYLASGERKQMAVSHVVVSLLSSLCDTLHHALASAHEHIFPCTIICTAYMLYLQFIPEIMYPFSQWLVSECSWDSIKVPKPFKRFSFRSHTLRANCIHLQLYRLYNSVTDSEQPASIVTHAAAFSAFVFCF